jgi:hypothetical protein
MAGGNPINANRAEQVHGDLTSRGGSLSFELRLAAEAITPLST